MFITSFARSEFPLDFILLLCLEARLNLVLTKHQQSSWGPMAWVVVGETFPLRTRAKQASLATAANWGGNCKLQILLTYSLSPPGRRKEKKKITEQKNNHRSSPHRLPHGPSQRWHLREAELGEVRGRACVRSFGPLMHYFDGNAWKVSLVPLKLGGYLDYSAEKGPSEPSW